MYEGRCQFSREEKIQEIHIGKFKSRIYVTLSIFFEL